MKLLIISLAGIGDTLFAGPLIHELRLNFPEAEIGALVRWPGAKDILAGNPHLSEVHQVGTAEAAGFLWSLRKRGYDVTINTIPQSKTAYRVVARLIGAPARISHDYGQPGWVTRLLVNRILAPDYSMHCIENNLALLPLAGAKPILDRHEYELFLASADREWADDFIRRQNLERNTILGIHVGSGGTKNLALRRWPLPRYFQLIREITDAHRDVVVLLMGGPGEVKDHAQLMAEVDPKRVFVPATRNLCQAAALLGKCRVFLSADTALMHLAAAMKVPMQVVIETPTWNKTVEPYGRPHILVGNPAVAGRNLEFYRYDGRGIRGTPESIVACMKSVSVESVYRSVLEALKRAGG